MTTHNWADRTTYQGKKLNWGSRYIMDAANKMVRTSKFGGEKENITMLQGSFSGAVSASAGTHNGGGAFDLTANNWQNRVKVFRLLGVAYWDRPALRGVWIHHNHGIVDGDGTASRGALQQVTAYHRDRDGLASNRIDTQYQMLVYPLFVFPEKAVGKPGKRWCTTACHAYEQQTTKSRNLGPINVGDVITVVAVTNVGGKYWGITADGRCVAEANFSKTAPSTTASGLVIAPTPVVTPAAEPDPASTPTVPTSARIRVSTLNVNADYMAGYNGRAPKLAKVIKASSASVALICESGNYADGALLNKNLGWGGVRGKGYVLHGGAVPVCTAVHLDPAKRKFLAEGQFETAGTINKWATWGLEKDLDTGVITLFGVTHCEYRPQGPNNIRSYDITRERQMNAMFSKLKALAAGQAKVHKVEHIPIVVGGDMNGDLDDPYDGPGKAAAKHGFRDSDRTAAKRINGQYSTHAHAGGLKRAVESTDFSLTAT